MKCEHCQQEVFDGTQHAPFNSEHKVCLVSAKQAVQSDVVKASADVIHSRASWSSTDRLADSTWVCGKATSFMFMPSGQHTICAGFRDGSIELSVNVTPETAKRVQASLDAWRAERPRQQPFGCIEHREHEASVCVTASCGFEWKEDGVYLTAEPTSLGANNVNGKVHRSWSPSFTTDADYAKASDDNGTLRFPDGVRGSKSNPAEITGIDFCLGTLTNRPAFIEMKPVKASETVQAAGTSEGVRKSWETRKGGAAHIKEPGQRIVTVAYRITHGAAKQYPYHGAKVYESYVGKDGALKARPLYEHGPDRRSERLAEEDALGHAKEKGHPFEHGIRLGYVFNANYGAEQDRNLKEKWGRIYNRDEPNLEASEKPFARVLASEASADSILAKVAERNKPPVVTIEQINERFGKTKTGDTRQTPDEILAKIYARSGASR